MTRDGQGRQQHAARRRARRRRQGDAQRRRQAPHPLHEHLRPGADLDHVALPGPGHAAAHRAEPHVRARQRDRRRPTTAAAAARSSCAAAGSRSSNSRFFGNRCDPTGPDLGGAAVRVLEPVPRPAGVRRAQHVRRQPGRQRCSQRRRAEQHRRLVGRAQQRLQRQPRDRPRRQPARGRARPAAAAAARSTPTATRSRVDAWPASMMTRQPRQRGRRRDLLRQQRPHRHPHASTPRRCADNPSDGFETAATRASSSSGRWTTPAHLLDDPLGTTRCRPFRGCSPAD